MSKVNVSIDLDWLIPCSEEYSGDGDYEGLTPEADSFSEFIKKEVVRTATEKATKNIDTQIQSEINKVFSEQRANINDKISNKLNEMMESFFETPFDVTDRYGDIERKNITVKTILKEKCDNFLTQSVDSHGDPTNYGGKRRINYLIEKYCGGEVQKIVDNAVKETIEKVKRDLKASLETQLSEKVSKVIGVDEILKSIEK